MPAMNRSDYQVRYLTVKVDGVNVFYGGLVTPKLPRSCSCTTFRPRPTCSETGSRS